MALPAEYNPKTSRDLIRLGRNNDGGYLVDQTSVDNSDLLISLGIYTDCSFEYDYWKTKKTKIISFDHTISRKLFRKHIKRKLTSPIPLLFRHFRDIKSMLDDYKMFKYLFSRKNVEHRKKEIGYPRNGCVDVDMIAKEVSSQHILFKIDIEGSEYKILDQLVGLQHRICGLIIEFHDCDLHQERIVKFIQNFKLPLVHIHGNNHSALDNNDNPISLELTFGARDESNNQRKTLHCWQPSPLDQPNYSGRADYILKFKA